MWRLTVVFGIVVLLTSGCVAADDGPWEPDGMGAWLACRDFVNQRLVNPSSADWPTQNTAEISKTGEQFRVQTYVDAENRMGGTVRSDVDCTVEPEGERQWRRISLDVDAR